MRCGATVHYATEAQRRLIIPGAVAQGIRLSLGSNQRQAGLEQLLIIDKAEIERMIGLKQQWLTLEKLLDQRRRCRTAIKMPLPSRRVPVMT